MFEGGSFPNQFVVFGVVFIFCLTICCLDVFGAELSVLMLGLTLHFL